MYAEKNACKDTHQTVNCDNLQKEDWDKGGESQREFNSICII